MATLTSLLIAVLLHPTLSIYAYGIQELEIKVGGGVTKGIYRIVNPKSKLQLSESIRFIRKNTSIISPTVPKSPMSRSLTLPLTPITPPKSTTSLDIQSEASSRSLSNPIHNPNVPSGNIGNIASLQSNQLIYKCIKEHHNTFILVTIQSYDRIKWEIYHDGQRMFTPIELRPGTFPKTPQIELSQFQMALDRYHHKQFNDIKENLQSQLSQQKLYIDRILLDSQRKDTEYQELQRRANQTEENLMKDIVKLRALVHAQGMNHNDSNSRHHQFQMLQGATTLKHDIGVNVNLLRYQRQIEIYEDSEDDTDSTGDLRKFVLLVLIIVFDLFCIVKTICCFRAGRRKQKSKVNTEIYKRKKMEFEQLDKILRVEEEQKHQLQQIRNQMENKMEIMSNDVSVTDNSFKNNLTHGIIEEQMLFRDIVEDVTNDTVLTRSPNLVHNESFSVRNSVSLSS